MPGFCANFGGRCFAARGLAERPACQRQLHAVPAARRRPAAASRRLQCTVESELALLAVAVAARPRCDRASRDSGIRARSRSSRPAGTARSDRRAPASVVEAQAEQRFDDQPVHPAGRAGVPGPAAAAGVLAGRRRRRRRRRRARPCSVAIAAGVSPWCTGLIRSKQLPGALARRRARRRPSPSRSRRACTGRRSRARRGRSP